ncbi:MAG: hypothetical protein ABJ308_00290 [Halieaceae bacterium]
MSSINQEINALIQADIDGVIGDTERLQLQQYLDGSEEVRAYYQDCQRLCEGLDSMEPLDPPVGLAAAIVATAAQPREEGAEEEWAGSWKNLFAIWFEFPVLRYATAFLVGAVLASSLSQSGLNDRGEMRTAGLAGTMSPAPEFTAIQALTLEQPALNGSLDLLRADRLLQLRFALDSTGPLEVAVRYQNQSYHLFGFSQEISEVLSLTAVDGEIALGIAGEQDFTVFLYQHGDLDAPIELDFKRDGETFKSLVIAAEQQRAP